MKKLICLFLSTAILLSTNIFAYAAVNDEVAKSAEYEYEINSNSPKWKEFISHDEMVAACRIPDEKIKDMSTEQLVSAYLNYPLLGDMYAYNTTEMGFEALRSQCNALDELLSRKDAGEAILSRYNTVRLYNSATADDASFNDFIEPSALEILAAQPEIIDNMDDNTFSELNSAIYEKCSEKQDDVYSATKCLYFTALTETQESHHENNSNGNSKEVLSINPFKSISVSSGDYNWNHTVKTPKKSSVKVGVLNSGKELSSKEKTPCKNYIASKYPGAKYISSATKKYNCHSFAWYSQSYSNGYWMNDPSKYMSDGSYKKGGYKVGNIIYYKGVHSGVVSNVKVGYSGCYVKSKWGLYGVYNHFYNYCPYSTSSLSYWTRS